VDVLPQQSHAVHVLTWSRANTGAVLQDHRFEVTVGSPHASVAVAVPSAPSISPAEGLHPSDVPVPPVVNTGGVRSAIQLQYVMQ
jgi:hypothetical protein